MIIEETEFAKLRGLPRCQVVVDWSGRFDSVRYPRDFYFHVLRAVQAASNESQLYVCVVHLLKWKDGKIQEDPTGNIDVGGVRYWAGNAKPNIYRPDIHDEILRSRHFYEWSKSVITLQGFSLEYLKTIKEHFELWPRPQSIVMPAFLLHILNPRVFPIFDQHVERARRFFARLALNSGSGDVTLNDYFAYHDFWLEWLVDCGTDPFCADYARVKQVDDALWSIGKSLSGRPTSRSKTAQRPGRLPVESHREDQFRNSSPADVSRYTTSSWEFINRVFSYLPSMTQSRAIDRAAREMGVELPESYLRHPGSHIDRWRKQGHPNRNQVSKVAG